VRASAELSKHIIQEANPASSGNCWPEEYNVVKLYSKKILKIIAEIAIASVVLLALIVGLLRAFFPYIDHYRPYFEQKLANVVHHPVKISKVNASWQGVYPVISLDNVVIYNNANQNDKLLKVQNFQIGINLLDSLIYWQLKPSLFHITGTHLTVRQQLDQQAAVPANSRDGGLSGGRY